MLRVIPTDYTGNEGISGTGLGVVLNMEVFKAGLDPESTIGAA